MYWNDAPCSYEMGFICESNPLLKVKNAELALLQGSLDAQTKQLKLTAEQMGALKKELELSEKSLEELKTPAQNLTNKSDADHICKSSFEDLKLYLDACHTSLLTFLNEKTDLLVKGQKEICPLKTESDIRFNQSLQEILSELSIIKNSSDLQSYNLLQQTDILAFLKKSQEDKQLITSSNPDPISCAVQSAILKAKNDELETLKKTNDILLTQLFAALMKSYETSFNRTTTNKNYNFFNKN